MGERQVEPEREPEREAEPEPEPELLEIQLSLVGAAHAGWFPTVGGGGGLSVAVRGGELWSVRASALAWIPSEGVVQEPIAIRLFGGALRLGGCLGGDVDVLRLEGCAVVEVGALRVEGRGLDEPASTWRVSLRAGAEARATLAVDALRLGLGVGLDAPLVRDRFIFEQADTSTRVAHEPAPVGGIVSLSIGFAL